MEYPLPAHTLHDIPYSDDEVTRDIGSINRDFTATFETSGDIISRSIAIARENGRIAVLDAGCGIGNGLTSLRDQVRLRTKIPDDDIETVGISLSDHRDLLGVDSRWDHARAINDTRIQRHFGSIALINLPSEQFDIAYSYQVLVHNEHAVPIINTILPSLAQGGSFYFDSALHQQDEIDDTLRSLSAHEWQSTSKTISRTFFDGTSDSKRIHRVSRQNTR